MRVLIIAAMAVALSTTTAGVPARAATFVFTAIPDQEPTRLSERFGHVATYLAHALGIDVRYVPVTSYPGR